MAITFVNAGAAKSVGSGNLASVALPASIVANDILICPLESADNVTSTFPAGWTKKLETNNGTICRQTIAWSRWDGVAGAPTITHAAGDSAVARIFAYRGCVLSGDPIEAILASTGTGGAGSTSATATASGITPTSPGAAVLFVGSESVNFTDGSGTNEWASYSGANPTFVEVGEGSALLGANEVSIGVAWGLDSDASATGSRTAAISGTSTPQGGTGINWVATLLALTPAAPAGSAPSSAPIVSGLRFYRQPGTFLSFINTAGTDPVVASTDLPPLPLVVDTAVSQSVNN